MRSKPEVDEESVWWYEAFYYLSASRPVGFAGALPILVSEVEAYCRMMDVPAAERPACLRIIRRLDSGFLALEKKTPAASPPPDGA